MNNHEEFSLPRMIGIFKGLLKTTEQEIKSEKYGNILASGTVQRDNIDCARISLLEEKAERLRKHIIELEIELESMLM